MGASAAVVCAGAVLASCGGGAGPGDGRVAVGAAGGGAGPSSGTAVRPTDGVRLVPLDGPGAASGSAGARETAGADGAVGREREVTGPTASEGRGGQSGAASGGFSDSEDSRGSRGSRGDGAADVSPGAPGTGVAVPGDGAPDGRTPATSVSPAPSAPPASSAPPGPAVLSVGEPVREAADRRWCEQVTVAFHNTGATAVRSGTVTFGTHIIGALGIDWGTVESTVDLPAPIGPGVRKEGSWTVCVDWWRVPLGMRVETRDVSVRWE
ncbi:hypothetical protein KBY47_21765 [Streptomyces sp. B93]|nr:hypothetical protein [Streptomyces sp. B93]